MQMFGFQLSFWSALPFSVLVATLAGIILGVPVLGMRGDYLAIVTLGFGKSFRIVALSDWLKPYIGGSNGITRIPRPVIGPLDFNSPGSFILSHRDRLSARRLRGHPGQGLATGSGLDGIA